MLGKIIHFLITYLIEILIVVGSVWLCIWIFRSGIMKRIIQAIIESKKSKLQKREEENDSRT